MKKTFYIILFFCNLNVFSQNNIYDILEKFGNNIINKETNYNLILISNSGCGYCMIALENLKQFTKKINIIVIDYGNTEEIKKLKLKYEYVFLSGNVIDAGYQRSFPKLFLYDNKGNLIWKKKGWFQENINKINSKIKVHNKT